MPDIPLRPIGRDRQSRAGYTKLRGEDGIEERFATTNGSGRASDRMPSAVRIAAAASYKGKRPARSSSHNYQDDPEEEETLLGRHGHEDGEDEGLVSPRMSKITRSVSCLQAL